MKKLLVLSLFCIFAIASHAQKKMPMSGKDCVMMKDGKMMEMMGGKTMMMDKDMTMKNGTMVMTDGTVKMKDGKTMMLKEGDKVWMSGAITHAKMRTKMKDTKM